MGTRRYFILLAVILSTGCAPIDDEQATGAASSALTSVTWTDTVGVNAVGNDLTKTSGTGFSAGAVSNEQLTGDGYTEFTTGEANTDKFAGLSNGNTDAHYSDVDFAFYLTAAGTVLIYEGGTYRATIGHYSAGDTFRVQVVGSEVTYYQNTSLVFTSQVAPTLPLLVDTSLYTNGATIQDVVIEDNLTPSSFWQNISGVIDSTNNLTKTAGTGFNAGASTKSSITIDSGYAQFTTAEANTDKMAGLSNGDTDYSFADIDYAFYLTGSGQVLIYEGGTYRTSGGSYAAGDSFRLALDSGVVKYYQNDELIYTSSVSPTLPLLLDTSLYTTGATIQSVVVAESPFWQNAAGVSSTSTSLTKTAATGWNAGASSTTSISADGYAQFTTGETNTDKLAGLSNGDSSLGFADIDYAFYLTGAGKALVYEGGTFRVNGGAFSAGDTFRVEVVSSVVTYYHNGSTVYTSTVTPTMPLLFDTALYTNGATISSVAIGEITTPAYWQNVTGVTTSNEDLTKTAANGWNAGASTSDTIDGDGYMEFTTDEANTDKMAGLSNGDSGLGYADIDFAIYLTAAGRVLIYESGTFLANVTSYVAGDVFRVETASSQVTYYKNGNSIWTSSTAPTFPLLIDTALYTTGATIKSATLSP